MKRILTRGMVVRMAMMAMMALSVFRLSAPPNGGKILEED